MNRILQAVLAASTFAIAAQASATVTLYSENGFRGRSFAVDRQVSDFRQIGRNENASSIYVEKGRWEVCSEPNFRGKCMVLRRGGYENLAAVGMDNTLASIRPVRDNRRRDNEAAVPEERPEYAYRRRHQERTFEAQVTEVRAVMGPPTQRCWVDRQQVQQNQPNIGGAIAGALIGGILGHQVGGGSGKDLATGAGVIGGAVVGNQVAGGSQRRQDVQRCENVSGGTPAYWDVTYNFRGRLHTVQMSTPPGNTVTVNEQGVPRS